AADVLLTAHPLKPHPKRSANRLAWFDDLIGTAFASSLLRAFGNQSSKTFSRGTVALNNCLMRRHASVLLTLGVLLIPGAVAVSNSPAASAAIGDISGIRVDNCGRVNARYYRCGRPEDRDYQDLAALGVKAIIN